jgi:hypothetical protein
MHLEFGTYPDWIQLLFVSIGGGYAIILFRHSNKQARARIRLEILDRFLTDEDIHRVLYAVDQGNTEEIRHRGELERQADKTLKYVDYIGFLLSIGTLKRRDVEMHKYEIKRLLTNARIKEYIPYLKSLGVRLDYLHALDFLMDTTKTPRRR